MAESPTRTLIWHAMRLELPAEWEVVRFSTSPRLGNLMLIDRRHQRLQLSWRALERRPDLEHMVRDYQSRDLQEHANVRFKALAPHNGWTGLVRRAGQASLTRALRYEASVGRLIELSLPWPSGRDAQLERRILESFSLADDEPAGPANRWCAFGLDVSAPSGWELDSAQVQPGVARMDFRFEANRGTVRRLGAAEVWLNRPLEQWLEGELTDRRAEVAGLVHQGHRAAQADSGETGPRWRRLWGRRRLRRDLAWHCALNDIVYHVTTLGPADDPVGPTAFAVRCCAQARREQA